MKSGAFGALLVALALSAGGCWEGLALQYAPTVLSTSVGLASTMAGAAQTSSVETPGVIELRKDPAGGPEYREMKINFTETDARWTPIVESDTSAEGWRPAVNFLQMGFSPPLPSALAEDHITYLAYAPLYNHESDEDEAKLKEFNRSFGDPVGTFKWNGHVYQYSLPQVLPPLEFD